MKNTYSDKPTPLRIEQNPLNSDDVFPSLSLLTH